jgi:peroxiredoxin
MRSSLIVCLLFSLLTAPASAQKKNYGKPVVKTAAILKSFTDFLIYQDEQLNLAEQFIAVDTASNIISKDSFLYLLLSGNYLPVKSNANDGYTYFQLYYLKGTDHADIRLTLKEWASQQYKYFRMEGQPLPGLNFTDINGNTYNAASTKGKIVVLKFWFIGCVPCVEEMPALNEIVNEYKNRDDIIFLSLAMDSKEQLSAFLAKKTFNYAVVAGQRNYMLEELKIANYPTHLIINKEGLVTHVFGKYEDMSKALKIESFK